MRARVGAGRMHANAARLHRRGPTHVGLLDAAPDAVLDGMHVLDACLLEDELPLYAGSLLQQPGRHGCVGARRCTLQRGVGRRRWRVHLTRALPSPRSMTSPGLASQDAAAGLANLRATVQASPAMRPTVLESLNDVLALADFSVNSKAWRLVKAAGIRMRPSIPVRGAPAALERVLGLTRCAEQGKCPGSHEGESHDSEAVEVSKYRLVFLGEGYYETQVVACSRCSACAKKKRPAEQRADAAESAAATPAAAPAARNETATAARRSTHTARAALPRAGASVPLRLRRRLAEQSAQAHAPGSHVALGDRLTDTTGAVAAAAAAAAAGAAAHAANRAVAALRDAAAIAARPPASVGMVHSSVEDLLKSAGLGEYVGHFTSAAEALLAVGGDSEMRKKCTDITGKQASLQVIARSCAAGGQGDTSKVSNPSWPVACTKRALLMLFARVASHTAMPRGPLRGGQARVGGRDR